MCIYPKKTVTFMHFFKFMYRRYSLSNVTISLSRQQGGGASEIKKIKVYKQYIHAIWTIISNNIPRAMITNRDYLIKEPRKCVSLKKHA